MAEFKIEISETVKGYFIIEAETEELAMQEAQHNLDNDTARSYNNFMTVDWSDDVKGVYND